MQRRLIIASLALLPLLNGCAGLFVAGAAGTAVAISDPRGLGTQLSDQSLEMSIAETLRQDRQRWSDNNINVTCYNGIALVTGQVRSVELREQIGREVAAVEGVRRTYNQLRLGHPAGLSTHSQDSWLTTRIKAKLIDSAKVSSAEVKVVTENGEVFLMGLTTRDQADAATEIARHQDGVRRVIRLFEYRAQQTS